MIRRWRALRIIVLGALLCFLVGFLSRTGGSYSSVVVSVDDPALQRDILAMAPSGASPLFFPYISVRKAILRAEPYLSGVKFIPYFSNGVALEIVPVARQPVALLENRDTVAYIDASGVVFTPPQFVPDLPVVALPPDTVFSPGEKLDSAEFQLLSEALPAVEQDPFPKFSSMSLDSQGEWVLFTKDGICIKAGASGDLQQRLALLPPILRVIRARKLSVAYIDIRLEKMPVVKVNSTK